MKKKLIYIFLILICCLCGLIWYIFNKQNDIQLINNEINNEEIIIKEESKIEKDSWVSYKNEYYQNGQKDEINESIYSLLFKNEKLEICNVQINDCYETNYIIEDDILILNKEDSIYLYGNFKILYEDDNLILRQDYEENNIYILYYFITRVG